MGCCLSCARRSYRRCKAAHSRCNETKVGWSINKTCACCGCLAYEFSKQFFCYTIITAICFVFWFIFALEMVLFYSNGILVAPHIYYLRGSNLTIDVVDFPTESPTMFQNVSL